MAQDVQAFLREFGKAVVERDLEQAANYLARWHSDAAKHEFVTELRRRESLAKVESEGSRVLERSISFTIEESSATLQDLRDQGISFPREVNESNFKQWCCLTLLAKEEEQAVFRLWCAVIEDNGEFRLGDFKKDSIKNKIRKYT
jgi:hypothetical protein